MGHPLPEPRTAAGRSGLAAVLRAPQQAVLAVDFDGTLAPIVADPERARAHPDAVPALARLAPHLAAVVVLTGRPAATAVRLGGFGGFDEFAAGPGPDRLTVLGAYGAERWNAATGPVPTPPPPPGVDAVRTELPALLDDVGAPPGTWTEDKGRALAVHTRRTDDPEAAFELLRAPLHALAERHGLLVEPGRMVLELRPPGVDKGGALTAFVREQQASAVVYAGDDLGDLAAFDAVDRLREQGTEGLLVCSAPENARETVADLADRADLTVDGPAGVTCLLTVLAAALQG